MKYVICALVSVVAGFLCAWLVLGKGDPACKLVALDHQTLAAKDQTIFYLNAHVATLREHIAADERSIAALQKLVELKDNQLKNSITIKGVSMPQVWTGGPIDAKIVWKSAATSGNVGEPSVEIQTLAAAMTPSETQVKKEATREGSWINVPYVKEQLWKAAAQVMGRGR